jgi:hypothetical protein
LEKNREAVKCFTGDPAGLAETGDIGGIVMDRSHLVQTVDLGIRLAVLIFMLVGGIVALVPVS